ncbi:MAG: hypothetical protein WBA89_24725 [Microcoleus sp.]
MSISNKNSREGSAANFVADLMDLILHSKIRFFGLIYISSVCDRTLRLETKFLASEWVNPQEFYRSEFWQNAKT